MIKREDMILYHENIFMSGGKTGFFMSISSYASRFFVLTPGGNDKFVSA
ncbi:Uncharacterized protein dnm_019660 [Desulfonema magnum]|uniref:Uncharacterized protein n=1 Tax=Desulfonema magnum TaxID=45655 RepID=A0A975GLS9_9BACT|nr:Uncharacterized protein dnm_019660 [Desulfonema magnum]